MSANKTNNNSNMTTAAGNNSAEQVAQDIPADLRLLIRIVMRTFYGFELYLVMEMLMLYPCIKEEDLAELLRLDLKTVQQHLKNLKKEKFLSEKFLMETSQDGNKQCKQNYFNINYKKENICLFDSDFYLPANFGFKYIVRSTHITTGINHREECCFRNSSKI